jgi:hypothetical protein
MSLNTAHSQSAREYKILVLEKVRTCPPLIVTHIQWKITLQMGESHHLGYFLDDESGALQIRITLLEKN